MGSLNPLHLVSIAPKILSLHTIFAFWPLLIQASLSVMSLLYLPAASPFFLWITLLFLQDTPLRHHSLQKTIHDYLSGLCVMPMCSHNVPCTFLSLLSSY